MVIQQSNFWAPAPSFCHTPFPPQCILTTLQNPIKTEINISKLNLRWLIVTPAVMPLCTRLCVHMHVCYNYMWPLQSTISFRFILFVAIFPVLSILHVVTKIAGQQLQIHFTCVYCVVSFYIIEDKVWRTIFFCLWPSPSFYCCHCLLQCAMETNNIEMSYAWDDCVPYIKKILLWL